MQLQLQLRDVFILLVNGTTVMLSTEFRVLYFSMDKGAGAVSRSAGRQAADRDAGFVIGGSVELLLLLSGER